VTIVAGRYEASHPRHVQKKAPAARARLAPEYRAGARDVADRGDELAAPPERTGLRHSRLLVAAAHAVLREPGRSQLVRAPYVRPFEQHRLAHHGLQALELGRRYSFTR